MSIKFQAIQYLQTTLLVKISIGSNGDERVIVKFYRAKAMGHRYSKKPTSKGKNKTGCFVFQNDPDSIRPVYPWVNGLREDFEAPRKEKSVVFQLKKMDYGK